MDEFFNEMFVIAPAVIFLTMSDKLSLIIHLTLCGSLRIKVRNSRFFGVSNAIFRVRIFLALEIF